MGASSVRPATPTQPLDFVGSKGQIRQLADGSWATWDGHDWVPTVIPVGQLDKDPVVPDSAGLVQLPSGLWVSGTGAQGGNALWVEGSLGVSGDFGAVGDLFANDLHIRTATSSRSLAGYGEGYSYESRNYAAGGTTTALAYLGVGITWTYNAKERLKFTYRAEFECTAPTQSNQAEWRLNLFGSSAYTGSVNTNDQNYDTVTVPAPYNSQGRMTINGFFHMPAGYWPDGATVYLALSAQLLFAGNDAGGTAIGWSRNGGGISSWPATLLKENIGYVP